MRRQGGGGQQASHQSIKVLVMNSQAVEEEDHSSHLQSEERGRGSTTSGTKARKRISSLGGADGEEQAAEKSGQTSKRPRKEREKQLPGPAPEARKGEGPRLWETVAVPCVGYGGLGDAVAVGCSGCSYAHWHATKASPQNFYRFRGTQHEYDYYARVFGALEVNHSFYQIPDENVVDKWRERTPRADFVYTLKAHRYFTHTKRAKVDEWFIKKWQVFYARWSRLGPYLGCILFQFPNAFRCTEETLHRIDNLGRYLKTTHPDGRFVFEFREPGWFKGEVYTVLRRWDLCLCAVHVGMPSGKETGSWGDLPSGFWPPVEDYATACSCSWASCYMRFHGFVEPSRGSYGSEMLRDWVERVLIVRAAAAGAPSREKKIFVFFNNDATPDDKGDPANPSAVADALRAARVFRESPMIMGKGEGLGGKRDLASSESEHADAQSLEIQMCV